MNLEQIKTEYARHLKLSDFLTASSRDLPQLELDELADNAEQALDLHTTLSGTLGTDEDDVAGLITDLLHLLDDIHLQPGKPAPVPQAILATALRHYYEDIARLSPVRLAA